MMLLRETVRATGLLPSNTREGQQSQQDWDGLTFDPEGEMIIWSGGIAALPARMELFSPFLRIILPSSLIGSYLVRIQNS
jgi:hypothetical protein